MVTREPACHVIAACKKISKNRAGDEGPVSDYPIETAVGGFLSGQGSGPGCRFSRLGCASTGKWDICSCLSLDGAPSALAATARFRDSLAVLGYALSFETSSKHIAYESK